MTRLLTRGILDQNGKRKKRLAVVRIGQVTDSKNYESGGQTMNLNEVTLDNLVEKRRLVSCHSLIVVIVFAGRISKLLKGRQCMAVKEKDSSLVSLELLPSDSRFLVRFSLSFLPSDFPSLIEEAEIVCCTLSGAGSPLLLECVMNTSTAIVSESSHRSAQQPIHFDVLIIDEAAQAVEPSTIIPFKFQPKVRLLSTVSPLWRS